MRITLLAAALLLTTSPAAAQSGGGWGIVDDDVARAAGLVPLRRATLASGVREVRVWDYPSLAVPKTMYRFVEEKGRVSGELVYYWETEHDPDEPRGETMDDLMRYNLRGRCGRVTTHGTVASCHARFTGSPPWKDVLAAASARGLWTLPDQSTLPNDHVMVLDGWGMAVELRDGDRYRTYEYDNPDSHESWPSAAKAAEIAGLMRRIDSLVAPPAIERLYRGLTTGRYGRGFRACDGKEWAFYGDVRHLARGAPASANIALGDTTTTSDTTRVYYVEVIGQLTPEWLARRWEIAYSRALEPRVLRVARPWSEQACPPPRP